MGVHSFVDEISGTVSYVVTDPASRQAAVIDSVYDYSSETGALSTRSADKIIRFLDESNLQLEWILETGVHLDHPTASQYLKEQRGGLIGISEQICAAQRSLSEAFGPFSGALPCDGREFDYLFQDGEVVFLGHLELETVAVFGYFQASVLYMVEDAAFVGDILSMPARGSLISGFSCIHAKAQYQSIQKIMSLPDSTRLYIGHQDLCLTCGQTDCQTTVLQEKNDHAHLRPGMTEEEFVCLWSQMDEHLPAPEIQLPVVEWNLRAGCLPAKRVGGERCLPVRSSA